MARQVESLYSLIEATAFQFKAGVRDFNMGEQSFLIIWTHTCCASASFMNYSHVYLSHHRCNSAGQQCALLKVQASKVLEYCSREASQIFGGASIVRVRMNFVGGSKVE